MGLDGAEGVLCIEGGAPVGWTLAGDDVPYGEGYGEGFMFGVPYRITFNGKTAKLEKLENGEIYSTTIKNSKLAASAAYIMALTDESQNHNNAVDGFYYAPKQIWVWNNFYKIAEAFGKNLKNVDCTGEGGYQYYNQWGTKLYDSMCEDEVKKSQESKATNYADNYERYISKAKAYNLTNIADVKISMDKWPNWVEIGPFKCDFNGTFDSITEVVTNKGSIPSNDLKNSNIFRKGDSNGYINSGEEFYIYIAKNYWNDNEIKEIKSLSMKFKKIKTQYSGTMWILKAAQEIYKPVQDIVVTKGECIEEDTYTTLKIDVDKKVENGRLRIKKVDDNNDDPTPIPGAKFKVYTDKEHKSPIKAIKNSTGDYTYNSNSGIEEFETDLYGIITISNLPAGTYYLEETSTTFGHIISKNSKNLEAEIYNGKITEKRVKNYEVGTLEITKKTSQGEKIDGAKFIIRISGQKKYLKVKYNNDGYYEVVRNDAGSMMACVGKENAVAENSGCRMQVGYGEKQDKGILKIKKLDTKYKYDIIEIQAPPGCVLPADKADYDKRHYLAEEKVKITKGSVTKKTIINVNCGDLVLLKTLSDSKSPDNGSPIKGVSFTLKCKTSNVNEKHNGKYVNVSEDGKITYSNTKQKRITDFYGKIKYKQLEAGTYIAVETAVGEYNTSLEVDNTEHKIVVKAGDTADNGGTKNIGNPPKYGQLKIEKVDKDTGLTLRNAGIGFKICKTGQQNNWIIADKKDGKYVARKTTNTDFNKATIFETNENGITDIISNLPIGNYVIYEVKLPTELQKYYELGTVAAPNVGMIKGNDVGSIEVTYEYTQYHRVAQKLVTHKAENDQVYISLSGYVWQDMPENENKTEQTRDGKYNGNVDYKLNGVTVTLKDNKGNIVKNGDGKECQTKTKAINGKNGYYRFEKVEIDKLSTYHIEFTYDGLTYQNVKPNLMEGVPLDTDGDCSRAAESEANRSMFNGMFGRITGEGQTIFGHELLYNKAEDGSVTLKNARTISSITKKSDENPENVIKINSMGDYTINASTSDTSPKFSISRRYSILKQQELLKKKLLREITNINLGLYERAQTDISLVKEVYSAKLSINGFNHVYEYGNYYKYLEEPRQESDFNVAVNWKTKRDNSYTGPIYRSDLNYINEADHSNELKVSVIYAIDIRNENINTDRAVKVNTIVDYYDNNYTVEKIGTEIDEKTGEVDEKTGEVVNVDGKISIEGEDEKDYNKYNKITIDTSKLEAIPGTGANHKTIYVQFKLSRDQIENILNNKESIPALDNIVEIASYSTIQNGQPYAAIDTDSIPNNIKVGDTTTYEDDTDKAPSFVLHPEDDRTLSGTVFVDKAEKSGTGNVREGDGQYEEGELEIAGVKVVMTEVDKEGNKVANGKEFETTTGENGEFTITGYTPAYYKVSYEWGNAQGINVKDFKGTIIVNNSKRFYRPDEDNPRNVVPYTKWYEEEDPRYSDAMDDYTVREKIDAGEDIKYMISATPVFGVGVDVNGATDAGKTYQKNITTSYNEDGFIRQNIKYMDFGIIERAKQSLQIAKTVDTVKITDASGRVLVDVKIGDDGKISGQTSNVTGGRDLGYIKAEIDNEIIQGSTAQIGYKIVVTNNSEIDYADKDFYLYGTIPKDDANNIVKLQPTNIYDYLDNDMKLDKTTTESSTETWNEIKTSDVVKEEAPTLTETYYDQLKSGETLQDDLLLLEDLTTEDGTVYKAGTVLEKGTTIKRGFSSVESTSLQKIFEDWKTTIASHTVGQTKTVRALKLDDKQVLDIQGTAVSPGEEKEYTINATSMLSNTGEVRLDNSIEIVDVEVTAETIPYSGRNIDMKRSTLYDESEWVAVTPPTGENKDYTMTIVISISVIAVLGIGIIFIKKKVLK